MTPEGPQWDFAVLHKKKYKSRNVREAYLDAQPFDRTLNDQDWPKQMRQRFSDIVNAKLAERAIERRYDPRSYEDMGLPIKPLSRISTNHETSAKPTWTPIRPHPKRPGLAEKMRQRFSDIVNAKLAERAIERRYDPRSYEDMGLAIKPLSRISRGEYLDEKLGKPTKANALIAERWDRMQTVLERLWGETAPSPVIDHVSKPNAGVGSPPAARSAICCSPITSNGGSTPPLKILQGRGRHLGAHLRKNPIASRPPAGKSGA